MKINPEHILKETDAFMYVYNNSLKQASSFMFKEDQLALSITSAAFVNHSYALELYIKCILCIEGTRLDFGHDLPKLYSKISEETKLIIEENYITNVKYYAAYFERHGENKKVDFQSILGQIPRAFVELRYIYEDPHKKGNNNYELESIAPSVRNAILKLEPTISGYL